MRCLAAMSLLVSVSVFAQSEEDAGFAREGEDGGVRAEVKVEPLRALPPTPPPDAGTVQLGFDVVQTLWGPGRKQSGEVFKSLATSPVDEGPLRYRWKDVSLALGLQYFARSEARNNADLNDDARDFTIGAEHRARVTARASAFGRVGALIELQDVRGWGTEPSPSVHLPATGVHQAFADVHAGMFDVRVGRQEVSYGEDRLIGSLDWSNTARAFDGLFVRAQMIPGVTIDGFGFVTKPPAYLTDTSGTRFQNSGAYFTGLYARWRHQKAGVDGYVLGLLEDPSTAATGFRPDHNRATFGVRGFMPVGPVSLVGEGALQVGTSSAKEKIFAGAFAARATWTLPVAGLYLLADVSGATGDGTPGDGTESTFHQLFPTAHIFLGLIDYVAWQNVVGVRGTIGMKQPFMHVWLDFHHLRGWDARGAWYNAGGAVFIPADAMRTDATMGNEIDLSVTVPISPQVAVSAAGSVFLPGGMAQPTGAGPPKNSPSTWAFLYLRTQL